MSSGSAGVLPGSTPAPHNSLLEAAEFVRVLQRRQGQLVCSPDEIAYHNGWVDAGELKQLAVSARQDALCAAAAGKFGMTAASEQPASKWRRDLAGLPDINYRNGLARTDQAIFRANIS